MKLLGIYAILRSFSSEADSNRICEMFTHFSPPSSKAAELRFNGIKGMGQYNSLYILNRNRSRPIKMSRFTLFSASSSATEGFPNKRVGGGSILFSIHSQA
ncbi:hypothetical protein CEXT_787371 [Caerostris extrusa]|uniref:Uncharacterized protein n=1 Tax=Caerostris extrusa TaxID=172846 RepID=A0AAV4VPD9_CAEEX|nr:hypothetical protein CEXT_787371 [Caerostris extrusa]